MAETRAGWWMIALAALTQSGVALAAEPQIQLSWEAPPTCPDPDWARAELKRNISSGVTASLRATVVIRPRGDEFIVRIRTEGEHGVGRRELRGSDCRDLSEATVLLLAMAAEGASPMDEPSPTAEPSQTAEGEAASKEPSSAISTGKREAPSSTSESQISDTEPVPLVTPFLVHAGVFVDSGAVSSWAMGPEISAGYLSTHTRLTLRVRMLPAHQKDVIAEGVPAGVGGSFWAWDMSVNGCLVASAWGRLRPEACAGLGVAELIAEGRGLSVAKKQTSWSPQGTAEIALRVGIFSQLGVRGSAGLRVIPVRKIFAVDGLGTVFSPPLATFVSSLALEVTF